VNQKINNNTKIIELTRVIKEILVLDDHVLWAVNGSTSLELQDIPCPTDNTEIITRRDIIKLLNEPTSQFIESMAKNISSPATLLLSTDRYNFTIHGDPIIYGRYDSLKPTQIPALWDALVSVHCEDTTALCTPIEWELLVAILTEKEDFIDLLKKTLNRRGYDSRLVVRLLREGRVEPETEDNVWKILESRG
tara:strand:- start:2269 stop:2847 length:579 start_codon:yes stop_codon:yes gene_type:complete